MKPFDPELQNELAEKLPPHVISVNQYRGWVTYYDYHGVTLRESEDEQQQVKDYILNVINERTSYWATITEWGFSNNGHFVHVFEMEGA